MRSTQPASRSLLVLSLALWLAAPLARTADAQAKRAITETDIFRFVWVADPQVSPDGRQVAFVRVAVNAARDGYETSLWLAGLDGVKLRQLTAGPRDSAPRWSPDSGQLVFVRGPRETDRPAQLYLLSMAGGEARAITDLPKGAAAPAWSPDGRLVAFTSPSNDKDLAKQKKGDKAGAGARAGQETPGDRAEKAPETGRRAEASAAGAAGGSEEAEHESDVRVITRAQYRSNGSGYLDTARPAHLWTVELPAEGGELVPPRQLTRGSFEEGDPVWSRDGALLYFTSTRVKEPEYEDAGDQIHAVKRDGGDILQVTDFAGEISSFAQSPDGRRIAFVGEPHPHPARSYAVPGLYLVDAAPRSGRSGGSQPRNLTEHLTGDINGGLTGDQHPPRGGAPQPPVWSADGRTLFVRLAAGGRADLLQIDVASATASPLTRGDHEVVSYAAAGGSRFALVISAPTEIGDLFAFEAASGRLTQLTRFNDALFTQLDLTAPEEITYRSFDGRQIQAWVQKPPGFRAGVKYPLILNIHGGPHSEYGYTFDHEFQWMAAKGYVVLYPNPRGSTGYGEEFGNVIQYHYPGDDYKDLMAGVDELLRRGLVDQARLGITGGSGGGILTNWAITQTHRFAAAVSQRSIADWAAFWYATDFTQFTPRWFHGAPWEDPADFAARSPITGITKVTTPLMLIEGDSDLRTPPATGGEQMFRALKYLKRPVVMVRFPGESHELSRSGRPWHRVERLQHIVRWFDKYLRGVKTDLYDVP